MIGGNFSPHKHPKLTSRATANDVQLIFLPTYSSWLNWIESEFAALRYFALGGTDHRTHAWQGQMIDRYMRWRNTRAPARDQLRPELSHPHPNRLPNAPCAFRYVWTRCFNQA